MSLQISGSVTPPTIPPKSVTPAQQSPSVPSSTGAPPKPASILELTPAGSATPISFVEDAPAKSAVPQAREFLKQVAQGNPAVMKKGPQGEPIKPEVYQSQPLRTEAERKRADRKILAPPHDNTQAYMFETLKNLRENHPHKPVDLDQALKAFDHQSKKVHLDELVAREYKGGAICYAPYQRQDMQFTLATDAVFREALGQADSTKVKAATHDLNKWLGLRSVFVTGDDEKRALNCLAELPPREFFAVLDQEYRYPLLEDMLRGEGGQQVLNQQLEAMSKAINAPGLDAANLKTYVQKYWQPIRMYQ